MLTRVFQSGNSLAVRIPKELAFLAPSQDVEIERLGNTLVVKPVVQRTLKGLGEALRLFPAGFMAQGRDLHEQRERDWDQLAPIVSTVPTAPIAQAAQPKQLGPKKKGA